MSYKSSKTTFGAGHNFLLPCQHLHPAAKRTNEIILETMITTTWQNLQNHTLKTLCGHYYTKTIKSTALFKINQYDYRNQGFGKKNGLGFSSTICSYM